jgi:release factor glutamine methyltransferase
VTTVGAALARAAARLAAAGVPEPARDARRLMAEALGVAPERLTPAAGEGLPDAAGRAFARMLDERARCRPVSQIVGRRAFWGRDFAVTGHVLDPRPETETLVAQALAGPAPSRILDLGTGSGVILVTLLAEWREARGVGTDIEPAALAVAVGNAERHGVMPRADFRFADWTDGITGRFDLVVCNPPYIAAAEVEALAPDVRDWEPRRALTSGPTGLEAYRRISAGLAGVLAPGGRALFEVGAGQFPAAAAVFDSAGFPGAVAHADLDRRERVLEIRAAH